MSWEDLFEAYLAVQRGDKHPSAEQVVQEARRQLSSATPEDWEALEQALWDGQRKWLVAAVFARSPVPRRLLGPMIEAAIYEVNPSANRDFVEPCIASYGHRAVNEALLAYVERGSDFEKAGAVNALYWAQVGLRFSSVTQPFTLDNATPESRAAYRALHDVWQRERCLFLREFVTNANVHVRRSIIPGLNLDEAAYPDDLKPLVAQAIEIARSHPDDYIRHRVEVQLGNERLLRPLPHRDSTE
jgi:hypothetical protein